MTGSLGARSEFLCTFNPNTIYLLLASHLPDALAQQSSRCPTVSPSCTTLHRDGFSYSTLLERVALEPSYSHTFRLADPVTPCRSAQTPYRKPAVYGRQGAEERSSHRKGRPGVLGLRIEASQVPAARRSRGAVGQGAQGSCSTRVNLHQPVKLRIQD
jgi:hypothetical protein